MQEGMLTNREKPNRVAPKDALTAEQSVDPLFAISIELYGQVQGVGIRPWLFGLANARQLHGTIGNFLSCAFANLEGAKSNLDAFIEDVRRGAPPPAVVRQIKVQTVESVGKKSLTIENPKNSWSKEIGIESSIALWSAPPDIATCEQCWADYFDPSSRFHNYPFVSCLACGPRWSVLRKLPFNRENTSYSKFPLCHSCLSDYQDPTNRRFHAQTMSCPDCGPTIRLDSHPEMSQSEAISFASRALNEGQIGAIKGLGGFQLLASAFSASAITRLRQTKRRPHQAFAVMFRDVETFLEYGGKPKQWEKLQTAAAPILSTKNVWLPTQELLAPDLEELGIMAPTTPLHYALLESCRACVVTSANTCGLPIPSSFKELQATNPDWKRLDFVMDHDREILQPIDDSVLKGETVLRAARGLRPFSHTKLGFESQVLALGADLKSSCAFTAKDCVVELPYFGKLDSIEGTDIIRSRLEKGLKVFGFHPQIVICDPNPQTLTNHLLPEHLSPTAEIIRAPHHEAHACSAIQDFKENAPTLILCFDGTGFDSEPSHISGGGEGYLWNNGKLQKILSLTEQPIIGGDRAVREPWRVAVAMLTNLGWTNARILAALADGDADRNSMMNEAPREALDVIVALIQNSKASRKSSSLPSTTSVGRWFDAVASIVDFGFRTQTYEAQAPIRLESLATKVFELGDAYLQMRSDFQASNYLSIQKNGQIRIEAGHLLAFVADRKLSSQSDLSKSQLAFLAHDCFAETVALAVSQVPTGRVAMSGGVFQNEVLRNLLKDRLAAKKVELVIDQSVMNDQCIALGQVAWFQYVGFHPKGQVPEDA